MRRRADFGRLHCCGWSFEVVEVAEPTTAEKLTGSVIFCWEALNTTWFAGEALSAAPSGPARSPWPHRMGRGPLKLTHAAPIHPRGSFGQLGGRRLNGAIFYRRRTGRGLGRLCHHTGGHGRDYGRGRGHRTGASCRHGLCYDYDCGGDRDPGYGRGRGRCRGCCRTWSWLAAGPSLLPAKGPRKRVSALATHLIVHVGELRTSSGGPLVSARALGVLDADGAALDFLAAQTKRVQRSAGRA